MLKKILILLTITLFWLSFTWAANANANITEKEFKINTSEWWIWIWTSSTNTTAWKANKAMWVLIQKMMIAMASLAFLIMVIGWTYMVIHHWEDEFLSKWKLIFMAWVYSLIIALSSYFIVWFVRFILYAQQ